MTSTERTSFFGEGPTANPDDRHSGQRFRYGTSEGSRIWCNKTDVLGLIMTTFALSTLALVEFVVLWGVFFADSSIEENLIFYNMFTLMDARAHPRTMLTDPGTVPRGAIPLDGEDDAESSRHTLYGRCQRYKPTRPLKVRDEADLFSMDLGVTDREDIVKILEAFSSSIRASTSVGSETTVERRGEGRGDETVVHADLEITSPPPAHGVVTTTTSGQPPAGRQLSGALENTADLASETAAPAARPPAPETSVKSPTTGRDLGYRALLASGTRTRTSETPRLSFFKSTMAGRDSGYRALLASGGRSPGERETRFLGNQITIPERPLAPGNPRRLVVPDNVRNVWDDIVDEVLQKAPPPYVFRRPHAYDYTAFPSRSPRAPKGHNSSVFSRPRPRLQSITPSLPKAPAPTSYDGGYKCRSSGGEMDVNHEIRGQQGASSKERPQSWALAPESWSPRESENRFLGSQMLVVPDNVRNVWDDLVDEVLQKAPPPYVFRRPHAYDYTAFPSRSPRAPKGHNSGVFSRPRPRLQSIAPALPKAPAPTSYDGGYKCRSSGGEMNVNHEIRGQQGASSKERPQSWALAPERLGSDPLSGPIEANTAGSAKNMTSRPSSQIIRSAEESVRERIAKLGARRPGPEGGRDGARRVGTLGHAHTLGSYGSLTSGIDRGKADPLRSPAMGIPSLRTIGVSASSLRARLKQQQQQETQQGVTGRMVPPVERMARGNGSGETSGAGRGVFWSGQVDYKRDSGVGLSRRKMAGTRPRGAVPRRAEPSPFTGGRGREQRATREASGAKMRLTKHAKGVRPKLN